MSLNQKTVAKDVKVADLRVGDKLLQDIVGAENRTLIFAGTTLSPREITFLRRQMGRTIPRLTTERYIVGLKTPGAIWDKDGKCLVRAGQIVTEEALAPLLDEGFSDIPYGENGKAFIRKNALDKAAKWHITHFNPVVRVETTTYLDDKGQAVADPRGNDAVVGGQTPDTKPAATAGGK